MTTKFLAKVISLRRITIPHQVCELLGIEEGDLVEVAVLQVHKKGASLERGREGLGTRATPLHPSGQSPEVPVSEVSA